MVAVHDKGKFDDMAAVAVILLLDRVQKQHLCFCEKCFRHVLAVFGR